VRAGPRGLMASKCRSQLGGVFDGMPERTTPAGRKPVLSRSLSKAPSSTCSSQKCPMANLVERPPPLTGWLRLRELGGNDVGVDDIAVDMDGLDRGEARVAEHLPCRLLSPHRAEAHSAV